MAERRGEERRERKESATSQYSIHDDRNCGCEEKGIAMPVAVAPTGPLGKNRKHLVNCNDCRFIFNIINIYALSHCFVAVCVFSRYRTKKIRFRFLTV